MEKNRICELLSIKYPFVQAPMSWISDAVLVASVSEADGLGVLGPNACVKVIIEEGVAAGCLCGDHPERYVEQLGVDAIVAVGYEGGGHLGIDATPTFVLVPRIAQAVKIPVLAGGGIVDGRGTMAAMILGAEGVYMRTRFIAANECPAHPSYKQAIINGNDASTAVFTGRVAICRAFKTPLVDCFIELEKAGTATTEENAKLHRHNSRPWITGNWDEAVFPCSVAAGLIKQVDSSAEVIQGMVKEVNQILDKLPQQGFSGTFS